MTDMRLKRVATVPLHTLKTVSLFLKIVLVVAQLP